MSLSTATTNSPVVVINYIRYVGSIIRFRWCATRLCSGRRSAPKRRRGHCALIKRYLQGVDCISTPWIGMLLGLGSVKSWLRDPRSRRRKLPLTSQSSVGNVFVEIFNQVPIFTSLNSKFPSLFCSSFNWIQFMTVSFRFRLCESTVLNVCLF